MATRTNEEARSGGSRHQVLPLFASHTYLQGDHLEMDADGESPREVEEEEEVVVSVVVVVVRKEGGMVSQGCERGLD